MGKKEHPGKRHVGRWILATLALAVIGVAVAGYFYFDVASWQRLDPVRLQSLAQTGSIFDKDGQFVTSLVGSENRTLVALEDLPDHVVNAFLAAEDLRFYKHPGFDLVRIGGALVSNLRSRRFFPGRQYHYPAAGETQPPEQPENHRP